jgi:hypothetical protein
MTRGYLQREREPMENLETTTEVIETRSPEVIALSKKVLELDGELAKYRSMVVDYEYKVEKLTEYLDENWDDPESPEIAEIFGIPLTKSIEVDVRITGTATLSVPRAYDSDDLRYLSASIDFSIDDYDVETTSHDLEVQSITEQ